MVKIGNIRVHGSGLSLPRTRSSTKNTLRSIARLHGVDGGVYFVKRTRSGGDAFYSFAKRRIVVPEQVGRRKIPRYAIAYYFFHELTHHLQREAGIFKAYCLPGYSRSARRRVALAAENYANRKACELMQEFFGIRLVPIPYPKEFLRQMRPDIFA